MKKYLGFFFVGLLAIISVFSYTVVAKEKPGKVALCHIDEEGAIVFIEVADRAVDAHLAHGDALLISEGVCDFPEPPPPPPI